MLAHLGREARPRPASTYGGLRDDEVDRAGAGTAPARGGRPRGSARGRRGPRRRGVLPGHREGRRGDVDGVNRRVRRARRRGRARCSRCRCRRRPPGPRRVAQRPRAPPRRALGLRPRDEHVRGDQELVPPEGLGAGQMLEGPPPRALLDRGSGSDAAASSGATVGRGWLRRVARSHPGRGGAAARRPGRVLTPASCRRAWPGQASAAFRRAPVPVLRSRPALVQAGSA